jgi:nucleoside-diphosphate-sugar epimerase
MEILITNTLSDLKTRNAMLNLKEKTYNIGISCIGSGVGQSVINSLRLSRLPLKTIGLGTNPFAYGAYDCNTYDYTKSIYDEGFIDDLIGKCIKHKVDLVIPGLDDEALLYAQNAHKFADAGIKAIFAEEELISICRDKERMSLELNNIADVFVKSYSRETLSDDIQTGKVKFPFIAKPRGGFASKGVEIIRSNDDLSKITEDHIIQELAIPLKDDPNYNFYMAQIAKNRNPQVSEVSIQVVYGPEGQLMGKMFSYNKLNNGVPIEIVPYENEYIWSVVDQLTPTLLKMGLKGPLNIQGRLTENGLKLFEMNPRFTGITGLRALMGFNEVEACVKEWLGIDKGSNQLHFNYNRFGIRQTADKSIPIERNKEVEAFSKQINGKILKPRKTLFITGACGYLGQNLINKLADDASFEIWAFDLDKEKLQTLFSGKVEKLYDAEDLNSGEVQLGNVDILLHLGFTRPHGTNEQIAKSLTFTSQLFTRAVMHHIPAIINISSQAVYGLENNPPWSENMPVAPQTTYAQAKYASELILQSLKETFQSLHFSSLRLCALAGGAPGLVEQDFLSKMCKAASTGEQIRVTGGMQQMERLDVRDAISAIISMLKVNSGNWNPIYNLGSGVTHSLKDIAQKVVETASILYDGLKPELIIDEKYVSMNFGMNNTLFCSDMNWHPSFDIEDTIKSFFTYYAALKE